MRAGDIVLAAFPFTDLSSSKRRPCIILADTDSPGDFVVAFVTTGNPERFPRFGIRIDPTHPDWAQTKLKAPSVIRVDRLCTLNSRIISGKLGSLSAALRSDLSIQLRTLFQL